MEVNFENSEIQRISYLEDSFIIYTKKESTTIYYKELLNIEHKEYESDEDFNSGIAALLSSLVGVGLTGDPTGLIAGPAGFGVVKFFYFIHDLFVDKKCTLVFKLALKKDIAFVGESESYSEHRDTIIKNNNNFFNNFLDKQNEILESWNKTLLMQDRYISLSDALAFGKNPSKTILWENIKYSNCFYETKKKKLKLYFENLEAIYLERKKHNDSYINNNFGNEYLKKLIPSQKKSV
jgi:hypothetical protein